ncbi:MAG: hypothetical protein GX352_02105 [Clostridiales bacterium]|nr:hypothetical protein [Clostridiales bacterium]
MKRLFKTSFFGYKKRQVKAYVLSLRKDYEGELSKKKDRMLELNDENRELKIKINEYQERLSHYEGQELLISKALVKAEESAEALMRDCYKKIDFEKHKIEQEKEKWKMREKEIIEQLLAFQEQVYIIMENCQSEINYLKSKGLVRADAEVAPSCDYSEGNKDILSASSM